MNIAKEQFVQIIEAIIEQERRNAEIADSLDAVVKDGANHSLVFTTPLIDAVVSALDYDGIISWWFWDGPECGKRAEEYGIYVGDSENPEVKKIVIRNASELYDYIMEAKR